MWTAVVGVDDPESFSSGVRPIPWLGQPCRLSGPSEALHLDPVRFRPVVRSPTSKPRSSLTFTKQSVCLPLTVNGRMLAANGPTVRDLVAWLARSGSGEFRPAR